LASPGIVTENLRKYLLAEIHRRLLTMRSDTNKEDMQKAPARPALTEPK
jgi:hypothetical protein